MKLLHHNNPGVKKTALKAALKLNQEDLEHVWMSTVACAKYDLERIKKNEHVSRWPHCSTYLNQGYYDREIGSYVELNERVKGKKCSQCENPSFSRGLCQDCLAPILFKESALYQEGVDLMRAKGLLLKKGESKKDYIARLQVWLRGNGYDKRG